jgi:hypothetical protein
VDTSLLHYEILSWSPSNQTTDRETDKTEEVFFLNMEFSPVPVPICAPQIPHGLTGTRTRTSAERPATNNQSHGTATNYVTKVGYSFSAEYEYSVARVYC